MRPGLMTHKVTLQQPSNVAARRGVPVTYVDVAEVWAAIRPMKTSVNESGKQQRVIGEYEIRIWATEDIDETWRIKHGTKIYNIVQADIERAISNEYVIIAKRDKVKD